MGGLQLLRLASDHERYSRRSLHLDGVIDRRNVRRMCPDRRQYFRNIGRVLSDHLSLGIPGVDPIAVALRDVSDALERRSQRSEMQNECRYRGYSRRLINEAAAEPAFTMK
jgi:hypothetical protein